MTNHLLAFFEQHRKTLLQALIGLGVVILATAAVMVFQCRQEQNTLRAYELARKAKEESAPQALRAFHQSHSSSSLGKLALIELAAELIRNEKYEEAGKLLQGHQASAALLKSGQQFALALAYKKQNKFPEAEKIYQELAQNPQNLVREYAQFELADCYEKSGRKAEAKTIFEKLASEQPTGSDVRAWSEERLLWLAVYNK